jgi:hypothetical protein
MTFSNIRLRASSSLITANLINWQLEIGNPELIAIFWRVFGEVAEWLKAALC